jgi:hypothetical protein
MPAEPVKDKKIKTAITVFAVLAVVVVYAMSAFGVGIERPEGLVRNGLRSVHAPASFHPGK